ncbi:MAG: transcriptional repressor NrdR [Deltaproteobacteria bacterium]|nr:transcriptional repressor NrdR [Deltaproteobacteria bacterium]MBW2076552.1 transcriptional repressor NrdR [Deltaproteobacteria bacterium]MBW2310196.1 transcriptional repressor NrdR [Deltaproteobacteria bacterium]
MKCPFCGKTGNKVIDSRLGKNGRMIRRRRECLACKKRFTTYEKVETMLPMVVKKDGRREPFNHEKIRAGIQKACQKRPISINRIDDFVDSLGQEFQESGQREIQSSDIGEKVIEKLKDWDDVAYVRFASVYRQFKDINEFMIELKEILDERGGEEK